jgi:hypothetical protein
LAEPFLSPFSIAVYWLGQTRNTPRITASLWQCESELNDPFDGNCRDTQIIVVEKQKSPVKTGPLFIREQAASA